MPNSATGLKYFEVFPFDGGSIALERPSGNRVQILKFPMWRGFATSGEYAVEVAEWQEL